jgi:L-asparaginase
VSYPELVLPSHHVPELCVDILYTGGTFGMVDRGDGLSPRAGVDVEIAEAVYEFGEQAGISFRAEYSELEPVIDSADADAGTARHIAARIRSGLASSSADGVIVIHGTDTMAYVGARLAFELHDLTVPVLLTGAQIPLQRPGSDAVRNLRLALKSIAAQHAAGTFIAFESALHPAVRASKRDCDGYDGFRTIGVFRPPPTPPSLPAAPPHSGRKPAPVGLFAVFPGMDIDLLDIALRTYHGGVVLECYGAGTIPRHGSATAEVIGRAIRRGTPVVVITHCDHGSVDLARYRPGRVLLEAGAIGGGDMTREAALAKLTYLADLELSGMELHRWMRTNLVGELSDPGAVAAIPPAD